MELRQDFPGVKIIAISGVGKQAQLAFLSIAMKLGAVSTLEKPFRPRQLLDAVTHALDLASN